MIVMKVLLTILVWLAGWMASIPGQKVVQAATKAAAAVQPDAHLKASSKSLSNGLSFQSLASTTLTFNVRGFFACLLRTFRWHMQRRRLLIHKAASRIDSLVLFIRGSLSPLEERLLSRAPSALDSHGVHDWHEASPGCFLTPLEVAAVRTEPDINSHVQRLLEDRWTALEDGLQRLEPLPENECAFFETATPRDQRFADGLQMPTLKKALLGLSVLGGGVLALSHER
jgi:hypothetical protein|eukprot:CAMPEP_0169110868 /NCGR_PEP_ID=MMETSP1015-20121227/26750_1 /TAXON_ID=342587 /ORGANISM="Karlodinium micrum, Strain CCMP2283" /LENGTH=227 /DNA_ID=CAMNT_0009172705 /DNA_START=69 /DNA_END=752 /DNA_ORIENTATION=+